MPIESERECGYRQIGKLYLVSDGFSFVCDNLPYPLTPCSCCGYVPSFTRNLQWIKKSYIKHHAAMFDCWNEETENRDLAVVVIECSCPNECPICHPQNNNREKYAFMWVGERYYTPETFLTEAKRMGVSKAIPRIPKDLKVGETLVLLAHRKVPFYEGFDESGLALFEPEERPAIFAAFVPKRIEMLIWESEATEERLEELKAQRITPIIVPDGDEVHGKNRSHSKRNKS